MVERRCAVVKTIIGILAAILWGFGFVLAGSDSNVIWPLNVVGGVVLFVVGSFVLGKTVN